MSNTQYYENPTEESSGKFDPGSPETDDEIISDDD